MKHLLLALLALALYLRLRTRRAPRKRLAALVSAAARYNRGEIRYSEYLRERAEADKI